MFGDVSGKGAAAALYGAMVSGLLRTLAHRRRSPAELLKLLNEVLRERNVERGMSRCWCWSGKRTRIAS